MSDYAVRTTTTVRADAPDDALTADMVGQLCYCPRRFHLMYVEGRWADNRYTVEGEHAHRRVDKIDHLLPDDSDEDGDGDAAPTKLRSVPLASAELGLSAKLDLVAVDGDEAVPVETKRGRAPDNAERCYDTHRVQLMCQGLLLREHGHRCTRGVVYFAQSRTRVEVPLTDELEAQARRLVAQARLGLRRRELPEPLEDSPKCNGCSLNAICMPDETLALRDVAAGTTPAEGEVRRLYPPRDDAQPLYVAEQGAFVGKTGGRLLVKKQGQTLAEVKLKDVSQLVLCGNVGVGAQTVQLLCEADVPVVHVSTGGWFYGVTRGVTLRNAYDRAAQFDAAARPDRCLAFARQLVADKVANQRTLLRRNAEKSPALELALRDLDDLHDRRLARVADLGELLGVEGAAAAVYFRHFASMLRPRGEGNGDLGFDFQCRNRRPPRDPTNALLSFAYALLAKECTVALLAEGLDPFWGLYHQPRHGRPALALDVMEPLRPIVADSAVVTAVNTGAVGAGDFQRTATACAMGDAGRRGLIRAFEARLDQQVTHPAFGYRCSWRSAIRVQARLLARWLRGDVPAYASLVTR